MRRLLLLEDGIVMPVAVAVLALITLLSGAVLAEAVSSSYSSTADRDSKRAFSSAEAGLQAAANRLSSLSPTDTQCFTSTATPAVSGECPAHEESLGNGGSYRYWVTPALSAGQTCAGSVLASSSGSQQLVQRCITAQGVVNGVTKRVQARVAALRDAALFPLAGIVGLEEVWMKNSADLRGPVNVGSNGQISLGNSSQVTGRLEVPQSAPEPLLGNSSSVTGGIVRRQERWMLPHVEFGNTATQNDNGRIVSGVDPSQNTTYVPATRALTLGNSSSVTLGGGIYNFCSLTMENSADLFVAAGARVRIFIDSPDRAGSGCPARSAGTDQSCTVDRNASAGSGNFTVINSARILPASNDPLDLQIYVYGFTDLSNLVDFKNSIDFVGTIHAPRSRVEFKNSATIRGAVAAHRVCFKNSVNFTSDADATGIGGDTVATHSQTAWRECTRTATAAGDPESGC
jgi:Tfp pilus assembly protein PilX